MRHAVLDLGHAEPEVGLDLLADGFAGEAQHLVLRAEPVPHLAGRDAGLGRDVAQADLVETAGRRHAVERLGDLPATLARVDLLRRHDILTRCSRIAIPWARV